MAAVEEPWTVARLLEWTTSHFAAKRPDSPRLDAEILLAHAMGCKRIDLYVRHGDVPSDSVRDRFRELVRGRARGEPVAYLVGKKEFFSLEFEVNSSVLIPRPETETLVDQALRFLKSSGIAQPMILDLGTGSGCIAITLAKLVPAAKVDAVDASAKALSVAQSNARKHGVQERIRWLEGDLFQALPPATQYHLIVSNPPYIRSSVIPELDPQVRQFEPHLALDGGPDGLACYRRIWSDAQKWAFPQTQVMVEVGFDQAESVEAIARENGWSQTRVVADMARIPRVVIGSRPGGLQ